MENFKPFVWIKFDFNSEICLGRTLIAPDGKQVIATVTEKGGNGHVLFSEAENVSMLQFRKQDQSSPADFLKTIKFKTTMISPSINNMDEDQNPDDYKLGVVSVSRI
jgi:hypothetical protein